MKYSLFSLVLLLVATACYTEPEFPVVPEINFERVQFLDLPTGQADTLYVTFSFKDGNGDIGIRQSEIAPPFHALNYVFKDDGSYLKIGDLDTLPDYNCSNYQIGTITNGVFTYSPSPAGGPDTVYIKRNRFHYNFFATIYTIRNGVERIVDFERDFDLCNFTINSRIPIDIYSPNGRALSGTITAKIQTSQWLPLFSNDSLRLKIQIADRELNLSNITESPVFTLRGVQINP